MCWEWINISVTYIVDLMVDLMFKNLVWSVPLNFLIVLGYPRRKFHAIGVMMSCCRKPSSIFPSILIHRSRWSPTSLTKDKNSP